MSEGGHDSPPDLPIEWVVVGAGTPLEVGDSFARVAFGCGSSLIDFPLEVEGAFGAGGRYDEYLGVFLCGHRREECLLSDVVFVGEGFVDDGEVECASVACGDRVS
jgi:hypothetical protein